MLFNMMLKVCSGYRIALHRRLQNWRSGSEKLPRPRQMSAAILTLQLRAGNVSAGWIFVEAHAAKKVEVIHDGTNDKTPSHV